MLGLMSCVKRACCVGHPLVSRTELVLARWDDEKFMHTYLDSLIN